MSFPKIAFRSWVFFFSPLRPPLSRFLFPPTTWLMALSFHFTLHSYSSPLRSPFLLHGTSLACSFLLRPPPLPPLIRVLLDHPLLLAPPLPIIPRAPSAEFRYLVDGVPPLISRGPVIDVFLFTLLPVAGFMRAAISFPLECPVDSVS